MLTDREVLSTINMLRAEHLDVRTVTMGINLFDCVGSDFDAFAYKVRAKIRKYAEKLVDTCDLVGDRYGIPVVNKRISVSPIGTVGASFSRDEMVAACRVLDEAAKEVGVDFIGGFGALVEKGMTPGERNLIDALPEALATTDRICSSINVGSTKAGINMDAVKLMGERILDVAEATKDRDAIGCAKLVVFCNIPQDVPFMAGAYLGVGEPDVVINVGVSGPGVVKKALDRAFAQKGRPLTITDAAEVIKHTAYKVTRVGELIGNEVASRLGLPFGVADLSLAPTPAVGDSVGEIFQSLGLSSIGAPGTTDAQRPGEEGRRLRIFARGRAFRRLHPGFRRQRHRSGGPIGRLDARKARGDDVRLLGRLGHDCHSRRYAGIDDFRDDCRRGGDRHDQCEDDGRARHSGSRQGRRREGGLRRPSRRSEHHPRSGRRCERLRASRRPHSGADPQPEELICVHPGSSASRRLHLGPGGFLLLSSPDSGLPASVRLDGRHRFRAVRRERVASSRRRLRPLPVFPGGWRRGSTEET